MKKSAPASIFAWNAVEIRRLHAEIHETFETRGKSQEHMRRWQTACREFRERYNGLAFPGGIEGAYERILAGDQDAINSALSFLEERPYFFRSGYIYRALIPKIRRVPLSHEQQKRFDEFLARYTTWRKSQK